MLDPSIWHSYRWLAWLPFSLSYWIGPSFYFYVKTLTNPEPRFTKANLWHFAPIILNYLHSIYHTIYSGSHHPWHWFHFVAELFESAAILSILIYMALSFRVIHTYQSVLPHNVSNTSKIDLQWVKRIIVVIMISFVMILIFLFISSGISGMELFDQWDEYRSVVLLLYAGVLYWLSIHGYRQAQTLKLNRSIPQGTSTPAKEFGQVIKRLDGLMQEQQLYTNPELSLTQLSHIAQVSERVLSEALNGELNKNFFQFVNEYRITEVQKKLKDPNNAHLKIISLAYDSGFNSKATFNRIFKSYTGITPKEYKSQNSSQSRF